MTVFAHLFLIDDPAKVAAGLHCSVGRTQSEPREALGTGSPASCTCAKDGRDARGSCIDELGIEGIGTVVEPKGTTRRATSPPRRSAWSGREHRLAGSRGTARREAARAGRQAPPRQGRPGRTDQHWWRSSARSRARTWGPRRERIQERTEACSPRSSTYIPQAATAVVKDLRTGEILALATGRVWTRARGRRARVRRRTARSRRTTSPGRLSRRSLRPARSRQGLCHSSDTTLAVPPLIQVATAPSARPTTAAASTSSPSRTPRAALERSGRRWSG